MAEVSLEEIGAVLILKNQEQFIAGIRAAIAEEGKLETATTKAGKAAKLSGGSFSFLGTGVKKAANVVKDMTLGVAALAVGIGAIGTKRLMDLDKAQAQTAAVIKSTGAKAGVTAKQVDALSYSIQQYSGLDRTTVSSGANMLLMFNKISNAAGKNNDIFNQALTLSSDLSIRMGRDVSAASLQLGKALQDPITGLLMLRRAGVIFTKQEQAQIKTMQAHGDLLGAQRTILARVRMEVGGAAAAYGKTVPGMLERAKQDVKDLSAKIVAPLLKLAVPVLEAVLGLLTKFGPKLSTIGTKIADYVKMFTNIVPRAMKQIGKGNVQGAASLLDYLFGGTGKTTATIAEVIRTIQRLVTIGQSLVPVLKTVATIILITLVGAIRLADGGIKFWSEHTDGKRRALEVLLAVIIGYKVVAGIWNATTTAMKAWNFVTKESVAGQTALDAALDANPIGLITIGIIAVAAAFTVAYLKVKWFRTGVDAVVSFFRKHWPLLAVAILAPFLLFPALVITFRDKIIGFGIGVLDWFKQHWTEILAVLSGPFGLAVLVIVRHFDRIKDAFKGAINWIIDKWNSIEFKLPDFKGWKVAGHTIIPAWTGPTIGVPKIPRLHTGGTVTSPGLVNIRPDEEIVSLPKSATVVPLSHPSVDMSKLNLGDGGPKTIQLVVDGKVLAETVYSNMRDKRART